MLLELPVDVVRYMVASMYGEGPGVDITDSANAAAAIIAVTELCRTCRAMRGICLDVMRAQERTWWNITRREAQRELKRIPKCLLIDGFKLSDAMGNPISPSTRKHSLDDMRAVVLRSIAHPLNPLGTVTRGLFDKICTKRAKAARESAAAAAQTRKDHRLEDKEAAEYEALCVRSAARLKRMAKDEVGITVQLVTGRHSVTGAQLKKPVGAVVTRVNADMSKVMVRLDVNTKNPTHVSGENVTLRATHVYHGDSIGYTTTWRSVMYKNGSRPFLIWDANDTFPGVGRLSANADRSMRRKKLAASDEQRRIKRKREREEV